MYISFSFSGEYSEGNVKVRGRDMKNNVSTNRLSVSSFSDVRGEKMTLDLFHKMATRVPAYQKFLKKHRVDVASIRTYDDLVANVPVIDKKNYLSQYPLTELCMDGDLFNNAMISVSSGSTGVPFFWPRGPQQDEVDTDMIARMYDVFEMDKKKTLLILSFSMGTWIAGTLFLVSSVNYANRGNPVSVLTPGVEKANAIDIIQRLASDYDQIVLGGYPPFLKDIVEDGTRSGIDWSKHHTRIIMGGESFSEEWRDYVLEMLGSHDPAHDSANIYGMADVGIVGFETPTSIAVRRAFSKNKASLKEVFGTDILPSLNQFDPTKRHFEKVGDELIVSSNSGIPLVRYNTKDTGGIVSYEALIDPLKSAIHDVADKYKVDLKSSTLPFVYLNGRKDFTVTLYALNIYPENVKAALIDGRIRQLVTGRFIMSVKVDESTMDQSLEIVIELAHGTIATTLDEERVQQVVVEVMRNVNAEYSKLGEAIGDRSLPVIRLVEYGDQTYFAKGVKHRWSKKEAK